MHGSLRLRVNVQFLKKKKIPMKIIFSWSESTEISLIKFCEQLKIENDQLIFFFQF